MQIRKSITASMLGFLLLLSACQKAPAAPSDVDHSAASTIEIAETTGIPAASDSTSEIVTDTAEATAESATTATETTEQTTDAHQAETEPAATAPARTEPSQSAPSESAKPTEPKPTEPPKPSEPKPSEAPKPTDPPTPADPAPTQPAPTQPVHTHSYKATVVAPTCTAKGYTEHKCSCGDSYKDSYTDALGHSFTEQNVTATCTSGGYTLRTCSRCKATETANTTPALGHDYRDTVVAPTTSSQGYTEHKCSRCGDSYRDNYTDKLKEVIDLQAIIDYGNAYAASLGYTVDKSLNLNNAGYYPGYRGNGYSLDFLKQVLHDDIDATTADLIAGGDTIPGFRCNVHASYDSATDKYYIVFLYG